MKINLLFANLILFFSLLFTIGCSDRIKSSSEDFEREKSELTSRIDSRIDSLNRDLESLREKANEAGENVTANFRVQLNELEEERQRLQAQKQQVENAVEEEWEQTKIKVRQALAEIDKNIDQEVETLENEYTE